MSEANCGISVHEVTQVRVSDSEGNAIPRATLSSWELTPKTSSAYSKESRADTSSQRRARTESETATVSRASRNPK